MFLVTFKEKLSNLVILLTLIFSLGNFQLLSQVDPWKLSKKDSLEFRQIFEQLDSDPERVLNTSRERFKETGNHRWKLSEIQALVNLERNEQALKTGYNAIKSALEAKDEFSVAALLNNLGNLHLSYGDIESAKKLFESALDYSSLNEMPTNMAINKIALTYLELSIDSTLNPIQTLEDGILFLQQEGLGNDPNRFSLESNLGVQLLNIEEWQNALFHFTIAKNYFENNSMYENAVHASNGQGVAYKNLNQLDSAKLSFLTALEHARKTKIHLWISHAFQNLSDLEQSKGNLETSLEYLDSAFMRYSMYREDENSKNIDNFNLKYKLQQQRLERKETEQLLMSEKNVNQTLILIGCIFILITLFVLFYFFKRRQQRKIEVKNAISTLELQALRAQMNPHFIFNCLNSIQYLFIGGKHVEANSYLTKFSVLVRDILEQSRKEFISLEQEVTNLKLYCELENFQFRKKFDYRIRVDQSITPSLIDVPIMLFQPFVENAINHGLKNSTKNGKLSIEFIQKNNTLICTIDDNGVGRDFTKKKLSRSHISRSGEITQNRIELLKKARQEDIFVEIIDKYSAGKPEGTQVQITITL